MFEGLLQRFKDLHTQTKLMVGFGAVSIIILAMTAVGVVTLQQLRDQFRVMNDGSTVALANLGVFGNSFVDYHRLILQLPEEIRKKEDLERALNRLSKVKMEVYQPLAAYETSQLRVSRSGRDEANDLALLKKSLEEYFKEAEGAGSALMDSFTEATLTAEQAHQMRALGVLAIVNNLTPRYENVITRHKEQLMSIRAVAGDINEDGQALARRSTLVLTFGGSIAVALGLTIGYLMARFFSRSVIHIADVATQAASGRLQARAKLDTHDELGQMATAFNAMLDRITALVQTEDERNLMQRRLMNFLVLVSDFC